MSVIASRASRSRPGGAAAIATAIGDDQASSRSVPSLKSLKMGAVEAEGAPTAKISSAAEARNAPLRSRTRLEATNAPAATSAFGFRLSASSSFWLSLAAAAHRSASAAAASAPSDTETACASAEMCVVSATALGSHITDRVAGNANAPTPPTPPFVVGYPNDETDGALSFAVVRVDDSFRRSRSRGEVVRAERPPSSTSSPSSPRSRGKYLRLRTYRKDSPPDSSSLRDASNARLACLAITCPVGLGRAYAEPRRGASSSRIKYALAPIAEPPRAVEAYLEGTPLASPSPYLACHAILTGDDPNRPTRPVGDLVEWRVSVGELALREGSARPRDFEFRARFLQASRSRARVPLR